MWWETGKYTEDSSLILQGFIKSNNDIEKFRFFGGFSNDETNELSFFNRS